MRSWLTRRHGEELDDNCLVAKMRRKSGWTFCGCFSSMKKGPYLSWVNEWSSIDRETCCERIERLVHGWLRLNPSLKFMQDGALRHAAILTLKKLHVRVYPILWTVFSPDLNPIADVWNRMKDNIESCYLDLPCGKQRSYKELCKIVREAWRYTVPET